MKEILIEQRRYLEEQAKGVKIVERERMFKEKTKLVKVVTGVRRCGKSFYTYLLLRGKDFGYVNFDDERVLLENPERIIEALFEIHGRDLKVLFFDEVQNLEKWEIFVNRLHREGFDLFLTGSNAKLLSSELATHLTGRHVKIELFPFSFREFLQAKEIERIEIERDVSVVKKELEEYVKIGGFPEVVVEGENPYVYLSELFSHVIEKDIVYRKRVRYARALKEIAYTLLSNVSNEVSVHKIKNYFKLGSEHTVKNYLEYLKEAYLFFFIDKFSFKPREIEAFPKKIYCIDTGFPSQLSFKLTESKGKLTENLVAIELLRRKSYWHSNWEIYYFKDYQQHEVDFLIKEGLRIKQLIQVTYANSFDEIDKREWRSLIKAYELLKQHKPELIIITWDYEDEKTISWFNKRAKIKFIPLWKWLLF